MLEISPQRQSAEQAVDNTLTLSKRIGLGFWFLSKLGVVNFHDKIKPYKYKYRQAVEDLRTIEISEGYPNTKLYIEQIRQLASHIPASNKEAAFYPFAGQDVFWAAEFKNLTMEDINYNSVKDNMSLWWPLKDYDIQNINTLLTALKANHLIPGENKVSFVMNDSEANQVSELNNPHSTLIYKSGHTFEANKKLFSQANLNFGAIIISNDKTPRRKVENSLKNFGYELVYQSNPPPIKVPWALTLKNPLLFLPV